VDAVGAGREATRHLVPVGVGSRDDHADLVGLGRLGGQDACQVGALLAPGRNVVGGRRTLVLRRDLLGLGVVAAGVGDDQAVALLGQLAQHRNGVVVAD